MQTHLVSNFSERKAGQKITALIIHHTGEYPISSVFNSWNNPTEQRSAHYIVDQVGEVTLCVPEDKKAWHAGTSELWSETDVNQFSIGIELLGDGNVKAYSTPQLESVTRLAKDIVHRHSIWLNRIVGHQHIAPRRKFDPGKYFPWLRFLQEVAA